MNRSLVLAKKQNKKTKKNGDIIAFHWEIAADWF